MSRNHPPSSVWAGGMHLIQEILLLPVYDDGEGFADGNCISLDNGCFEDGVIDSVIAEYNKRKAA